MQDINDELPFLTGLIQGIANQFGSNCEVVLLDLSNYEEQGSRIVAIENGYITGRKVGDSGTNLGLEVLRGTDREGDKHNYVTQTKSGRILRSTTMYIRNTDGVPVGCICINFDVSELIMAENTIKGFTLSDSMKNDVHEVFVNDVSELMDVLLQEAQQLIGKPVAMMTKEDKLKGIKYLDQKGLFLVKKSGDKVCTYFDISKYTLYSYLEEVRVEERNRDSEREQHFQV